MKKIIFKKILIDLIVFFLLFSLSISLIIWVLQAINYLDFVVEDGHGFIVYLKYTLLNFPKIFSKVFSLILFFSFSYIILRYEYKNELIIFWNFGISKLKFTNIFIKFSILFLIVHLIINTIIVPNLQDKARSYIRSSNIDFFENILKPKKFIDVINNLTIFFEDKMINGNLKNIYLRDNSKESGYQITIAKKAKFEKRGSKKILVLYDGKTQNIINGTLSEFKFAKSDFGIEGFDSKSTTQIKTQEHTTIDLLKCMRSLQEVIKIEKNNMATYGFNNCRLNNLINVNQELYTRIILPFYNTFLVMLSLLLILKSKNDSNFNFYKNTVYLLGFLTVICLETSTKFLTKDIVDNYIFIALPFVLFFLIYYYFIKKTKIKKL